MRGKAIDRVWPDDVVRPHVSSFLDFSQVILLEIIEVVSLIVISWEVFFERDFHGSEMNTIVLSPVNLPPTKRNINHIRRTFPPV